MKINPIIITKLIYSHTAATQIERLAHKHTRHDIIHSFILYTDITTSPRTLLDEHTECGITGTHTYITTLHYTTQHSMRVSQSGSPSLTWRCGRNCFPTRRMLLTIARGEMDLPAEAANTCPTNLRSVLYIIICGVRLLMIHYNTINRRHILVNAERWVHVC
jgi:hypothetical protein